MPSHRTIVRSALTFSMTIRAAIDSAPNLEVLTVFCLLENKSIGVLFK